MTRPIARSEERAFFERPVGRAAARRSPQALIDSRSGLEECALRELDGEVRSAAGEASESAHSGIGYGVAVIGRRNRHSGANLPDA